MAVVWNARDESQENGAQLVAQRLHCYRPRWRCIVERSGFKLFYYDIQPSSSSACLLNEKCGAVLGTIFSSGSSERKTDAFSQDETEKVLASDGCYLVTAYSGRYVACLHRENRSVIVRAPTGGVRCLHAAYEDVHLIFSDMDDLASLRLEKFSVDWNYMAAHLVTPVIQSRGTALSDVTEIPAGECLQIEREQVSRRWHWHPFLIASSEIIEDLDSATDALRLSVLKSVHAWAKCYPRIVLKLSGGLDSSILAACLACAPSNPDTIAVNHYAANSGADERVFARLAAQRAGIPLIEQELEGRYKILPAFLSERPGFYLSSHQSFLQLGRSESASSLMDGESGDQLFMRNYGKYAAADFRELFGVRPEIFQIAWDVALMENITIWTVLREALRGDSRQQRVNPLKEVHRPPVLVSRDAFEVVRRSDKLLHPWFESDIRLPPGKWWHVFSLSNPIGIDDSQRQPGDPECVSPFYSQSVIETTLRIPTHLHVTDGWDRAIARRAFSGHLPSDIGKRYSKGTVESPLGEILANRLGEVREVLLDGQLVKRGLLDRVNVEKALSGTPSDIASTNGEVFLHYCTELWLHQWESVNQCAAV